MKICPLDTRDQLPLAAVLPPWSGRYRTARAPRGYTRWEHTPNDLQEWGFSATAYSGSSHKWGELNHSSVGKLVGRRCTGITSLHPNIIKGKVWNPRNHPRRIEPRLKSMLHAYRHPKEVRGI